MRLIDADALMEDINESLSEMTSIGIAVGGDWLWAKLNDAIEHAQTIEERKKGKWEYNENGMDWNLPAWVCSECRCRNDNIPTMIKMGKEYRRIAEPRMWQGSRFCPNCGADMRGEEDEKED